LSEIKTSQKGVEYAPSCTLKTKTEVYSRAMLWKIPHEHTDKQDISLKLGRYVLTSGKVEANTPKSELTLDNEELNELIRYISDNYTPVVLGEGEYINISGRSAELIRNFKKLIEGQADIANLLIKNGILSENVFLAATTIKKRDALSDFESNLRKELPEKYWQDWFTTNKWVLGSDFAQIINERAIDTENIADYIMRAFDGFVDLVEIKKPNGLPFWSTTKDHKNYIPSTDLIKAITQCLSYIHAIEQEVDSIKFNKRTNCKIIKPRCILVYGRSHDWIEEQREAYRILNAAYNQLSILTYDHLLMRAKNVLGIDEVTETEELDDLPF